MSCLIGLHLGGYVMLGADRMVYHPNEITYTQKIARTRFGLVAGCGLAELTDNVADRLASEIPVNLEHVQCMVLDEVNSFQGLTHVGATDIREHTMFMVTGSDAATHLVALNYLTPENQYLALPIVAGRGLPIVPMDAPAGAFEEMVEAMSGGIRMATSADDGEALSENIRHHSRIIGEQIGWIAHRSRTVSPEFQIAVHLPSGIRISEVLSAADQAPVFREI